MLGSVGGVLVAFGACVSTYGTLNGFTLLSGQVPLSAARDGLFPKRFGRLSGSGTPAFALIVSNTLATIVVAMNFSKGLVEAFTFIILLATLTTLVPYLFCALAELMIYVRTGRTVA
ncbi:MAG: amino acid permease, partial [Gammaproteobacteria bacterium]